MSTSYLAPLQLKGLTLSQCDYKIEDTPAEQMSLSMDTDATMEQMVETEGSFELAAELGVTADLVDAHDPKTTCLHSYARVRVDVAIPKSLVPDASVAQNYLCLNATSIGYSHIRSCLMMIMGLSPAAGIMLPAVLPQPLADAAFESSKESPERGATERGESERDA